MTDESHAENSATDAAAPLQAVSEYLPRARRRRLDIKTLRGVAHESARTYSEWRQGRISRSTYACAISGLAKHKDIMVAIGNEEQLREIEQIRRALERIEGGHGVAPQANIAERVST